MRAPKWFKQDLADEGRRVIEHEIDDDEATDRITDRVLEKDERFTRGIVRDYVRKKLRAWTTEHIAGYYRDDDDEDGEPQLDMFPELPRRLETAPGRFVDITVMNRHDWNAALVQAQVKAANASGFAALVERAHDQIVPLLISDNLTTADVWRQPGQAGTG